jgi:hypothetical protein
VIGAITAGLYGTGAPPAAPNSYESIATVLVGSGGASTIDFTSIPSTYKHLQIRLITRSANATSEWDSFFMNLNSDSTAAYSYHALQGNGASASASAATSTTGILLGYQSSTGHTSGIFSPFVVDILDYADTNKFKTTRTLGGFDSNNTGTEVGVLRFSSGNWRSTAAVSSIRLTAGGGRNTAQNSTFALYGIKG